jgi:glycosyltransferase involved in cell wall biosynthesis
MVSVITPSYNSEKFISKTILSVLNQSFLNLEMIIADDRSTDKTISIIEEFIKKDKRIRLIKLETNGGPGKARNAAISKAKGDYIAFLDSDDTWHKRKIELQLKFMQENDYLFSFTSYLKVNDKGKVEEKINAKSKVTYKTALYKNPIGCLTAMYSRKELGTMYFPEIRKRQDYALWLKILKKTPAYGLNEYLSNYTNRSNSISSNKWNLIRYEWNIYRKEEKLSLISSSFYLTTAIILRILRIIKTKV